MRPHTRELNNSVAHIKELVNKDKFLSLWGYIKSTQQFAVIIAPVPLVYLEEVDELTGKKKIYGRESLISSDLDELECMVKVYLSKYYTH